MPLERRKYWVIECDKCKVARISSLAMRCRTDGELIDAASLRGWHYRQGLWHCSECSLGSVADVERKDCDA